MWRTLPKVSELLSSRTWMCAGVHWLQVQRACHPANRPAGLLADSSHTQSLSGSGTTPHYACSPFPERWAPLGNVGNSLSSSSLPSYWSGACIWLTQRPFPHSAHPANQSNRAKWQSALDPPRYLACFPWAIAWLSDALGMRAPASFQRDFATRPTQMAGPEFCGGLELLLLGPGILKSWTEGQAEPGNPSGYLGGGGISSTLATRHQPLRGCSGTPARSLG